MNTLTSHQLITGLVAAIALGFLIGLVVMVIIGRR